MAGQRWRSWAVVLLCLQGCSSFVAAEPDPGDDGSGGATDPDAATSDAPMSGSTTLDSAGSSDSDSDATTPDPTGPDSGPDPSASQGSDSDPDPSGSTSTGPASTTGGEDPSSTGGDASTGEVALTCADLVLPEQAPATCSVQALDFASITINNDCQEVAVDVYWVGYSCNEIFFARIEPGGNWGLQSFQTHPWRIRNGDTGELMREIPPLAADTTLAVLQR